MTERHLRMRRRLALALVCGGTTLAAAYTARLTPSVLENVRAEGRAQLEERAARQAQSTYCAAAQDMRLEPRPDCRVPSPSATERAPRANWSAPSFEEHRQQLQAALDQVTLSRATLRADINSARQRWLRQWQRTVDARAHAEVAPLPSAAARLREWVDGSAVIFFVGLLCIVGGGLMLRSSDRRLDIALVDGSQTGALDFGAALAALAERVQALNTDMMAVAQVGRFGQWRARIETLQQEGFAPLTAVSNSARRRYGATRFALIFSPLSAAERWTNRTWSTLTDEHWAESLRSIEVASQKIQLAAAACAEFAQNREDDVSR